MIRTYSTLLAGLRAVIVGAATIHALTLVSGCGSSSAGSGQGDATDVTHTDQTTLGSEIVEDYGDYSITATQGSTGESLWEFSASSRHASSSSLRFEWDFGVDDQVYEGVDQSFSFPGPDTYLITVSAYERNGNLAFALTLELVIPVINVSPVARAGNDQFVFEEELVLLDGTESVDPDGTELSFQWTQNSGPPVVLLNANGAIASFVSPFVEADTQLVFQLTVSDGEAIGQDTVVVETLESIDAASFGPTADAGPDQQVTEEEVVTLDGSNSSGSGTAALAFEWLQLEGPSVTLSDANNEVTTFQAPVTSAGPVELLFHLVVSEGDQSDVDPVSITVLASTPSGGGGGTTCSTDAECDDGLFCNGTETCAGGSCVGGSPVDCGDSIACTLDACNENTDSCDHTRNDAFCDNGLFCDGQETCLAGFGCQPGTYPCPGATCQEDTDSCQSVGCTTDTDCDDGSWCNGSESCTGGVCQPGAPILCDDGVSCTVDSCDETADTCRNVPNDTSCDNGQYCDGVETCDPVAGCQTGSNVNCDDAVDCTIDVCNEATDNCIHIATQSLCDNGLFCDGAEVCDPALGCQSGASVDCDDGLGCTDDWCNEGTNSCDNVPSNANCDDGLYCNGAEQCAAGTCQSGDNPCTGQQCDEAVDACVECLNDSHCNNGLYCDGLESCVAGVCQAGSPVVCDDGVSCTVDSCDDTADTCRNVPDNTACDNGLFCDGVETCDLIAGCQTGSIVDCDDAVDCTIDACNEGTNSCMHTATQSLCDNGLFCDGAETCDPVLGCQAGASVDCDDSLGCTDDSCNEGTDSCDNVPNDANCNDGLFCNGTEQCVAGTCQSGDAPCSGQQCDEAADACVECLNDSQCDNGLYCDGQETCVGGICLPGAERCPGATCDEAADLCVDCLNDGQCNDGQFCNGAETCVAGTCQSGNDPCLGEACDEADSICVECLNNGGCDNGVFCDGSEICVDGTCQANSDPCPGQQCDEPGDACVECLSDGHCDDGQFCNGAETCVAGTCQTGTSMDCDDDVACTVDSCDEVTDSCDHVVVHARCDNGLFCDGTETCDALLGCLAGTNVDCGDGVSCTVDTCNENSDSCDHTVDDTACDNGQFCDGQESCHALLGCQPAAAPCDGQMCDETVNACVQCLVNADCDDGQFCNGSETCVAGTCQAGASVDCNDGVGCTVDSCNEATDSCDHVVVHAQCDNGLFCDGTETCDALLGCLPGTNVDCDDGVSCTIDTCNENSDACEHAADDTPCDNRQFCDGQETCHALLGCQPAAAPCAGQMCDESTDACVQCLANEDCDDGVFCNGLETCAGGACAGGSQPCPGQLCSETTDECVDCLTDGDCGDGLFCNGTETCVGHACQTGSDPCDGGPCEEANDICTPPTLETDVTALDFGLTTATLDLDVWNSGGGTLSYTAVTEPGAAWLIVTPTTGSSTGEHDTLAVAVDRTDLTEGNHQAEITMIPNVGAAIIVTATLAVGPAAPGPVGLSEDFETFNCNADPAGWYDSAANNSLAQNDSLFNVACLGNNKALGTQSTSANIHSHYVSEGSDSWTAYTYTGRMMISQSSGGIGVTVLSDYATADTYYRLRRGDFGGGRSFHISPHGTAMPTGTTDSGVTPSANQWYRFLIETTDTGTRTEIKAKVWADGSAEPGAWQIDCYDASGTRLTAGTVGVWSMGGGGKYWDDLVVDSPNCDVDSDGDSEPDCSDGCPTDPNKTSAGVCGCGTSDTDDEDNDGVPDCIDQCPGPDTDSDNDGTADCNDDCPSDAEKTAPGACGCGVADTDSDNDGTPDCLEPPTLCVGVTSINFGCVTTNLGVEVWNCGTGTIGYTVSDDAGWLTVTPPNGSSSGEHDTLAVTVNRSAENDGMHQGEITVTPSVGSAMTILVTMTVGACGSLPPPQIVATRTSGTAPLAVYFEGVDSLDANGKSITNAGLLGNDIEEYTWTILRDTNGDGTGDVIEKTSTGFAAAHVFEPPGPSGPNGEPSGAGGVYTVRLTIRDRNGAEAQSTQQITVNPFTGTTYYVRADGNDSNIGTSPTANTAWKTYNKGFSGASAGARVLFRRGDTFPYTTRVILGGGALIAAYGTGDLPIIQYNGTGSGGSEAPIRVSGGAGTSVVDLHFILQSTSGGSRAYGFSTWNAVNVLILRVTLEKYGDCTGYANGLFVVDSKLTDGQLDNLYFNGSRLVLLNNEIGRAGSHNVYGSHLDRAVIQGNTIYAPGTNKSMIRFGANHEGSWNTVASDNTFDAGGSWLAIHMGTSSGSWDLTQHFENLLFERNTVTNAGTCILLNSDYRDTIIRGNIFQTGTAFSIGGANLIPDESGYDGPKGVWFHDNVINNTGEPWYTNFAPSPEEIYLWNNTVNGALVPGTPPQ